MCGWRPSPPKWPSPIRSPRRMPISRADAPWRASSAVGAEILALLGCFTVEFPVKRGPSCFTVEFPVKRVSLSMGAVGTYDAQGILTGTVERRTRMERRYGGQAAGDGAGRVRAGDRGGVARSVERCGDDGAVCPLSRAGALERASRAHRSGYRRRGGGSPLWRGARGLAAHPGGGA